MKKSIKKFERKAKKSILISNLKIIKGGHPGKGYSRPRPASSNIEGHVTIIK